MSFNAFRGYSTQILVLIINYDKRLKGLGFGLKNLSPLSYHLDNEIGYAHPSNSGKSIPSTYNLHKIHACTNTYILN